MRQKIEKLILKSIQGLHQGGVWPVFDIPSIVVSRPKSESFGDYTTNIALVLAKQAGKSPMEIAQELCENMLNHAKSDPSCLIEIVEAVRPGHINITLSLHFFTSLVGKVVGERSDFGTSEIGKGIRVNNEFISANPTGPLTVGNGRGGFYGDALGRVLGKASYEVVNEYYVNDAGEQVLKLGHSVLKDEKAVYGGEYIEELHQRFGLESTADVKEVGERAAEYVLREYIQKTVSERMRVHFDRWTSEKALFEEGFVDKAIALLQEKGLTFEVDGAIWFRSTQFGDDKDRVLIKSDGSKTYFASDCGYILHKMERGFKDIIEIWGADHHGYISRFRAASQALGFTGDTRFLIVQLVKVVKDGKEVRMSKRAGNVVLIDDLIETVGHDVARFFFLMYAPETHMNFDLDLAQEHSQKNPVFYVQYAHARMASILRKAEEDGLDMSQNQPSEKLKHEKEIALIREIALFSEMIEEVAANYEVHRLPHYAIRLADKFHSFYNECRVIDEEDEVMTQERLKLVKAVQIVLAETLRLIGVSAPEKM